MEDSRRMNTTPLNVLNSFIYEKARHKDDRGFFEELFSQKQLVDFNCVQINCSKSKKDVLRGVHIVPFSKLVHCVKGRIFDVVVDMRKQSPTYLKWDGVELNSENCKSLFIPANCGHAFLSLENDSMIVYAQNGLYNPKVEFSINYSDPKLNIKWPGLDQSNFILSTKDQNAPFVI
jgi:dTDP-4-dehydrorhamnose 3,5-epimerase